MLYLDTSVLVPLFVPEPDSEAIRLWFGEQTGETLAISDWTLTEFASAMGIKVREKALKRAAAAQAGEYLAALAKNSLRVFTPTRADYARATELLSHHALGLRAGDSLHSAVAMNRRADFLLTLDRRFIAAGRTLGIRIQSPISVLG